MIATGDRVAHHLTGARGVVTSEITLQPDFAGDQAGPWFHVAFDDGLRCWCPAAALVPEASVLQALRREAEWASRS